ncbi:hypothetical protein [Desulfovibrio sp. JC010]|uniref:hypothetical protein n=1 Tax=Desulfovibrio sp. JC010 TaxID=2593641 RepID=UPI0013D1EF13|nr:hypothetical protein [Desulfovibrio sp. JC010]NDV27766.1 hypothetical protein [Desulfovibrio sp. JC010]
MWKSIVITTALLFFGVTNAHAGDFGYKADKKNEKHTIVAAEKEMSFSDILNGLDISENISTNLVFGLEDNYRNNLEGRDDPSQTMGLGLGFSFSF